ncbi:MAG: hypothetical protein WC626_12615 [Methanoregula sp.]
MNRDAIQKTEVYSKDIHQFDCQFEVDRKNWKVSFMARVFRGRSLHGDIEIILVLIFLSILKYYLLLIELVVGGLTRERLAEPMNGNINEAIGEKNTIRGESKNKKSLLNCPKMALLNSLLPITSQFHIPSPFLLL